ncbi:hypothetical protein [Methylobacterium sp. Leaf123]|uniref:hypothetical protein n=1 Tax=Methylobacterium sp. Leaf123 TaxID=1736264 RepID=UPI000A60913C|nr:hypothetical protein [Methylobacterium sp. Leaf123]
MIEVDIKTKIISSKQKLWVIYSGTRRQYYDQFYRDNVVFLDYPELRLSRSDPGDKAIVRQHVRMSNAFDQYERSNFSENPPSGHLKDYSNEPFSEHSSRVKASNIRRMFFDLEVGDLIMVPGGPFDSILFGEVAEPFDPNLLIRAKSRKSERKVQGRRVAWTRADAMRASIPHDLQKYFQKPPAISRVPRDLSTERLYGFAYESYVLRDLSFQLFDAPGYSGKDPRGTEDINQLVSYLIAAYEAIDRGEIVDFANLEWDDAIDKYYNEELVLSYEQVFRSPGHLALMAAAASLAAFVGAGVSVSISRYAANDLKNGISITNSENTTKTSAVEKDTEKKINFLMNSLGEDRIKKMKKKGKNGNRKLRVRPRSTVK